MTQKRWTANCPDRKEIEIPNHVLDAIGVPPKRQDHVMIKKRNIVLIAGALLILGGGYALFCVIYDRYEERCRTRPQRVEAKRQEHLNQQVSGYLEDDAMRSAAFRMISVEYFGGYLREWEYADGSVVYRERPGMPGTPVASVPIQLDENQRLLFADVLNLVVKQELWNQSDLQQLAADGGEQTYEFSVSGHSGQFKVINIDPPHLDIFRHKCWKLMESLKEASRKPDHNKVLENIGTNAPNSQQ